MEVDMTVTCCATGLLIPHLGMNIVAEHATHKASSQRMIAGYASVHIQ